MAVVPKGKKLELFVSLIFSFSHSQLNQLAVVDGQELFSRHSDSWQVSQ
jgi:hypothetical protein